MNEDDSLQSDYEKLLAAIEAIGRQREEIEDEDDEYYNQESFQEYDEE